MATDAKKKNLNSNMSSWVHLDFSIECCLEEKAKLFKKIIIKW